MLEFANDTELKTLITEATLPVLIDFWGEDCPPCRRILPVMEELAAEYAGRIVIGKMNVADAPEFVEELGINSVPTFAVFRHGVPVDGLIGAVARSHLVALIEKNLGSSH